MAKLPLTELNHEGASVLWDQFERGQINFVENAWHRIASWRAHTQAATEQIAASRIAIDRSLALLDRCTVRQLPRRSLIPRVTGDSLRKLVPFSIVFGSTRYNASFAESPSGRTGSCFITVYSEYGERSAWISGIEASEAAKMILAKIAVRHFVDQQSAT